MKFSVSSALAGSLLLAASLHAEPNPVSFTGPSTGFSNGSIQGQNGWVVFVQPAYNGDFIYTTGTGVSLKQSSSGAGFAYTFMVNKDVPSGRDTFHPGDLLSMGINFVVTEAQSDGGKGGGIVGLGWGQYAPVASNNLPFFADLTRAPGAAGYKLNFRSAVKGQITGDTSVEIPAAALGLDAAANRTTSDPLQLSFSLTQTDGVRHDWATVAILTNLKTKKSVVLKNEITGVTTIYAAQNLLRAVVNERTAAADDHLSSVIITQMDPDLAADPAGQ